jgi:hypothetical protein
MEDIGEPKMQQTGADVSNAGEKRAALSVA